jgi:hypothetical protein
MTFQLGTLGGSGGGGGGEGRRGGDREGEETVAAEGGFEEVDSLGLG